MRVDLHPGFVLHHRPYRETSLLVEIFSSEHGRVGAVAKGAKRRWRHEVQLFRPVTLSWSGRGELVTLTAIEPASEALRLPGEALASAFYVNELLIRLVHRNDPDQVLYAGYDATLHALAKGTHIETVLRKFEKSLLDVLGYGPITDYDVVSGAVLDPATQYFYVLHQGPSSVEPGSGEFLAIAGQTLLDIGRDDFSRAQSLTEAKQLMRFLLKSLLGDKPLASRELLVPRR